MRYRNRSTGTILEAFQLTTLTFADAPPPDFTGVMYDRQKRRAFIKADVACIGDWIVRDPLVNVSVYRAAAFEREYKPIESNVVPFRR